MSDAQFIMGIDGGTQSTKVGIFDQTGRCVAAAQVPLKPIVQTAPGYAVHPDDDLWDSLVAACHAVMREFGRPAQQIKAIGLCSIRCCRVITNPDGVLVEPVISWMDQRLARRHETPLERDHIVTTTTGYLGLRLTGQRFDTAANYEGVWPLDKRAWNWVTDEAAFEACGLRRENVSELRLPGEPHGELTINAAEQLGLCPGTPVICTANDKAVEALGAGLHNSDAALISLGTYVCGMQPIDQFKEATESLYTNLACVPFHYLVESGGVREGMRLIPWFKTMLGLDDDELLDALVATAPVGSNGLRTLPDWLPPADAPHRKGVTIGWQAKHTRADFARSVYEGIVLTMVLNMRRLWAQLDAAPERILLSGGGANSSVFPQLFADALNLPVGVPKEPSTVALGAAMCATAGCASSVSADSVLEAAQAMQPNITWREPISENASLYQTIRDEFYEHFADDVETSLQRLHDSSLAPDPSINETSTNHRLQQR